MPEVKIDKPVTLDLLDQQKPGLSTTSDMPVIETKPDASPDAPAAAPEGAEPDESAASETADTAAAPEAKKPAKGVQKRIDELTRQREDERRARIRSEELLEQTLKALHAATTGKKEPQAEAEAPDDPEPAEPDAAIYTDQNAYNADYRTYLRQMARWEGRQEFKAQQKRETETRSKREAEERARRAVESYQSRVVKAREKYPDYDAVVGNRDLPITVPMRDAIIEDAERGTDIAYFLGTNPDEAARISKLPPRIQFMELGLIAARLQQAQKPAATGTASAPISKAPAPIKPLQTGTSAAPSVTQGEESMEAYAARRAKQLQEEARRPGRR